MSRALRNLAFAVGLSILAAPSVSRADEPWILSAEGAFALAFTSPQRDLFGPGGSVGLGLYKSLGSAFLIGVRGRGLLLSNGDPPSNGDLKDPGWGSLASGSLAVRIRPFASSKSVRRNVGLWIEGAGGVGFTSGRLRPVFEAGLGYGFALGETVSMGPMLRYLHIYQPSKNQIDESDARIALAGIEFAFFDAKPAPIVLPKTTPIPRSDRDGDGLWDPVDECPDQPEDKDSFEDEDGCPDPDNDKDGVLDADDKCPNSPEDKDGFEDNDGCPDPDNDQDGFLDIGDDCPNQPETINGVDDKDGCPDQGLIEFVHDRVILEERVLFDFEKARVRSKAKPTLAAIVELWRQHPEWARMRVEGHADSRGDPDFNQELSERRARAVVKELVKLGFPRNRVDSLGFGSSRPRETGDTEEAYERNRRVEFVVTDEGDEIPAAQPPKPSSGTGQDKSGKPSSTQKALPREKRP